MIWYIEQNGQTKEIPEEVLRYKIKNQELSSDTLVVNEEIENWIPLKNTALWKDNIKKNDTTNMAASSTSSSFSPVYRGRCFNCGTTLKLNSKFCGKCGAPLNLKDSQYQPRNALVNLSSNVQEVYASKNSNTNSRFFALGIIGVVFGVIGFIILPIVFNVIGLIFGIITCSANPKEDKEFVKAMWRYKNKARGVGVAAVTMNIVGLIIMIFNMLILSGTL